MNNRYPSFPVLLVLLVMTTGCLTPLPRTQRPSDASFSIPTTPLTVWGDNQCGSGALATVLTHYGAPWSEADLDPLLPKGRNDGVVSLDLLLAARDLGYEATMTRGETAVVEQHVLASEPVILMLRIADLPGERRDLFHYIVVDGVDRSRGLLRTQFGDGRHRWVALSTLEKSWEGAGRATIVVKPDLEKTTAERFAHGLRRAVMLEEQGRIAEAIALYEILRLAPDSPTVVLTNLGNALVRSGDKTAAEEAYRHALRRDSADRDASNNLAWLLYDQQRDLEEAEGLARAAVAGGAEDRWIYSDTLGRILLARGEIEEGRKVLSAALTEMPPSQERLRGELELLLAATSR